MSQTSVQNKILIVESNLKCLGSLLKSQELSKPCNIPLQYKDVKQLNF